MYLHLLIAKRERLGHCNPLFRLRPLNPMELFRQFFFPPQFTLDLERPSGCRSCSGMGATWSKSSPSTCPVAMLKSGHRTVYHSDLCRVDILFRKLLLGEISTGRFLGTGPGTGSFRQF
jgi:hypothetical protein